MTGYSVVARAFLCALWTAVLLPTVTLAQAPQAGGNGIKVGEGRVHPYFDLELKFDSAGAYYSTTPGGSLNLGPEMVTHIRPGLRMEVPGNSVYFNLNGNIDYVWYTGLLTPGSQFASHLGAAVDVGAEFNQEGAVGFQIADRFVRSDRTQNPAVGLGVISLFNEVKAGIPIHPGGRALEVIPGASYTFELFDPLASGGLIPGCAGGNPFCDPSSVSQLNYSDVGFHLDGRYKFLPKTAFVLDADFNMRSYATGLPGAMLLNATAGLAGLVSPKVAVVAKAGWAHDFGENGARTVVGHLELNYLASETANIKVGYVRTLQPVAVLGFFGDDRGYVEGRALFGGRLTLRGYAGVDFLTFYTPNNRNDLAVNVNVGPEYQFTPWFSGAAGYALTVRSSNQTTVETLNYARNEGYVRLSLIY